jgi:hypothetical protein
MAKLRGLRISMAFRRRREKNPPEELIRNAKCLTGWKKLSQINRSQHI